MEIGICSYSFHRLLEAGKQDIFKFITDCKDLGCTQLDPWNAHLKMIRSNDAQVKTGPAPAKLLSDEEVEYVKSVRKAADTAGMPFGNLACDKAHIYDAKKEEREILRTRRYRWLEVAKILGAKQIRIDCGGPEELPEEIYRGIREGYRDIIDRAKAHKIEVVIENHWGPSLIPDNVVKMVEGIDGLGYLFDSYNWKPGMKEEGRKKCAKYATATHFKTFAWDDQGNETTDDVPGAVKLVKEAGYKGVWGIESTPTDGEELVSARNSVALLKRLVGA